MKACKNFFEVEVQGFHCLLVSIVNLVKITCTYVDWNLALHSLINKTFEFEHSIETIMVESGSISLRIPVIVSKAEYEMLASRLARIRCSSAFTILS